MTDFVKRVVVFGGAFNPVTLAHERIVQVLADYADWEVLVVPCDSHPFGKQMAPFSARLKMCQKAFTGLGSNVIVSDVAKKVGSNTTADLLDFLRMRAKLESKREIFYPVIGLDEAKDICKWHRWSDLLTGYKFIVFERTAEIASTSRLERFYWKTNHTYITPYPPIPDVSSSQARTSLSHPLWDDLDEMYVENGLSVVMSKPVFDYAVKHGLYGAART